MTDAPRYRLVGYDIGTAPDENGGWVHWTDHEAIVARLTAERDAALAGAVKVKPLVWFDAPNICTREKADALGGHYSLVEFDAGTDEAHFAVNIDLGGLAFVFILEPDPFGGRRPKQFPTLDAAKAAAQADYDARILSAIQPAPEARQAALAKAWKMGRDAAAAWHTMQAETAMGALCCGSDNYEIRRAGRVSDMHRDHSNAIRALTPPADLAAKIGGEA